MGEMLLEMRHISKSFPGVRALKGVDFSVQTGEIMCLLGENGAGKSTLMKILAGVHEPDEGSILFEGKPVRSNRALLCAASVWASQCRWSDRCTSAR